MEPHPKKQRLENSIEINLNDSDVNGQSKTAGNSNEDELFSSFEDFEVVNVLSNSEDKCFIAVEGKLKDLPEKAVVTFQKLPFNTEKLKEIFSSKTALRQIFKNDVYYNQVALLPQELNEIKVSTIYPANEKHIKKYVRQASSFINETPELYESITSPFIESHSYSKQWIYNILEHKKEVDRILCEDLDPQNGFVMVPDMKWTGEQVDDLYYQAIVMRRDIYSIRDLRVEHIPLLNNLYDKCTEAIKEHHDLPASKLRIYFHYHPSYYHLHVHISALSFDAPGTWTGKAHLLKDVVSNLEIDSNYYKKANLSFTVKDNHPLKECFEKKGYFSEK